MSLPILIFAVVVGVSLIVFAVHLSGGKQVFDISERVAIDRFQEDFPEAIPEKTWVSMNRRAALLVFDGALGLVSVFGDKFLTRWIEPGEAQIQRNGNAVSIKLDDVTWPGCTLNLPTEADAVLCEEALVKIEKREMAA